MDYKEGFFVVRRHEDFFEYYAGFIGDSHKVKTTNNQTLAALLESKGLADVVCAFLNHIIKPGEEIFGVCRAVVGSCVQET